MTEEEVRCEEGHSRADAGESCEDILAKYRRKGSGERRPRRASDAPDADPAIDRWATQIHSGQISTKY